MYYAHGEIIDTADSVVDGATPRLISAQNKFNHAHGFSGVIAHFMQNVDVGNGKTIFAAPFSIEAGDLARQYKGECVRCEITRDREGHYFVRDFMPLSYSA